MGPQGPAGPEGSVGKQGPMGGMMVLGHAVTSNVLDSYAGLFGGITAPRPNAVDAPSPVACITGVLRVYATALAPFAGYVDVTLNVNGGNTQVFCRASFNGSMAARCENTRDNFEVIAGQMLSVRLQYSEPPLSGGHVSWSLACR